MLKIDDYESDSDLGYEEDAENGLFSDDEDYTTNIPRPPSPSKYPFARPTNYHRRFHRRSASSLAAASPTTSAVYSSSARRGRGHIRVIDKASPPTKVGKGCSRHCSPPPAPSSRSSSHGHVPRFASRSTGPGMQASRTSMSPNRSDAGPRAGRAGSPMPSKVFVSETEEEENEVEEDNLTPPKMRGGWRSDDAGLNSLNSEQFRTRDTTRFDSMSRNVSAPPLRVPPVAYSSGDVLRWPSLEDQPSFMSDGVTPFLRRASENLPVLARPSISRTPSAFESSTFDSTSIPQSAPIVLRATGPPAVNATPAMAHPTAKTQVEESSETLADGSETALSAQCLVPSLLRTKSLSSRVTFQTSTEPSRSERGGRLASHGASPDETAAQRILQTGKTQPIACPRIMKH